MGASTSTSFREDKNYVLDVAFRSPTSKGSMPAGLLTRAGATVHAIRKTCGLGGDGFPYPNADAPVARQRP